MRPHYYTIVAVCFSLLGLLCSPSLSACSSQKYCVKGLIDLHGEILKLPENTTIVFKKGGKIVNGSIFGNNTKIKGAFDDCLGVTLTGTWYVKVISDTWFDQACLSDNEIIKNLNILQSDKMRQTLYIDRDHCLELSSKFNTGLSVASNTKVFLNAVLSIEGNNLERYNIVSIAGKENVIWEGGEVRGDVGKHNYIAGSTSEWGFGVYIYGARNISITGLQASLCTGDGFYISGDSGTSLDDYSNASKNIVLRYCVVHDDRRDGFSLVHAIDVLIEDCKAINMGLTEYTPPCFGINIEPNKNKAVKNVQIVRFKTSNSYPDYCFSSGGYQLQDNISNRENIALEDCIFDKGVGIASGGITINRSTMKQLVLYTSNVPTGEPGNIIFNQCTISGGNGIQFDGRKRIDINAHTPYYLFTNCDISTTTINKSIPGFIWGTDLDNVYAKLVFDNCQIRIQPELPNNNIIAAGFIHLDCSFKCCEIDSRSYVLKPRGIRFVGCDINCKSTDNKGSNSLINCRVKTSQ